jgi:hypothetical protein
MRGIPVLLGDVRKLDRNLFGGVRDSWPAGSTQPVLKVWIALQAEPGHLIDHDDKIHDDVIASRHFQLEYVLVRDVRIIRDSGGHGESRGRQV